MKRKRVIEEVVDSESDPEYQQSQDSIDSEQDGDIQDEKDRDMHKVQDTNVKFSCPECPKEFKVYFQASKHIQEYHAKKLQTNKAPLEPIKIETCRVCTADLGSQECLCSELKSKNHVCCLGCQRLFPSVKGFNLHISSLHVKNIDSMFFKTEAEFKQWKAYTEAQLGIKYHSLSKARMHVEYFQCNHVSAKNSLNQLHLCPSVIIFRRLPSGIQIHHHKLHFEHECNYHQTPPEFEKFITNRVILDQYAKDVPEIYIQFKILMDKMIQKAKVLDSSNIKTMYSLALEMETKMQSCIVEQQGIDKELKLLESKARPVNNNTSRSLTDRQIVEALEETATTDDESDDCIPAETEEKIQVKMDIINLLNQQTPRITNEIKNNHPRRQETPRSSMRLKGKNHCGIVAPPTEVKKKVSIDNVESKTTDTKKVGNKVEGSIFVLSPKQLAEKSKVSLEKSPSFVDTFRTFVDNMNLDAADYERNKLQLKLDKSKILNTKRVEIENPLTAVNIVPIETFSHKSVPKMIPKSAIQPAKAGRGKKVVVKTKIGQFSPKKTRPCKDGGSPPSVKQIVHDNYEVLEQENDCNILVLKI